MADESEHAGGHNRRSSQATSISLLHLDPEPIESPVAPRTPEASDGFLHVEEGDGEEEDGMESSTASTVKPGSVTASTTSGVGLSGSRWGGSSIFYCTGFTFLSTDMLVANSPPVTRVQRYSSYAMSLFTTLHLANVSLLPATMGSVDASETFLLMTREIYQTSIAEPLLVALPFVAHVGSGVALRLIRRTQNIERYGRATPGFWATEKGSASKNNAPSPWPALSWISVSGYAFTVFYSAHVFMNRLLPLAVEGDSSNIGLGYVAHGFARHPWVSRLAYAGLITVGTGHMVWGAARWMGISPSTTGWLEPRGRKKAAEALVDKKTRRERRRRWMGVHAVAMATAALWAVGGLGVVARGGASEGWVGSIYEGLYARVGL